MLRIIIGAVDKDELFSLCFTYAKQEDSARIVLAECISVFLRHCINVDEIADLMLLSIVFQLCEDKLFNIRQTACECLAYLLTTKYQDQIELKLYEMAIDPSPYVRNF
jgi:hypothetical protein